MIKVKLGAIIKDVSKGALKWYEMAGWKIIKEEKKKESNSKKITSTQSNI